MHIRIIIMGSLSANNIGMVCALTANAWSVARGLPGVCAPGWDFTIILWEGGYVFHVHTVCTRGSLILQ